MRVGESAGGAAAPQLILHWAHPLLNVQHKNGGGKIKSQGGIPRMPVDSPEGVPQHSPTSPGTPKQVGVVGT